MKKKEKKAILFWEFLKKQWGWFVSIFIILCSYAIVRTYSISFVSKIVQLLQNEESISKIMILALIGFCFAGAGYGLRYIGSILCTWLTEKLALETRCRLMEHLQKIPYRTFETKKIGQLQSVLRNDVQRGADLIYTFFSRILQNIQLFIATFIYMFLIQPWMATAVALFILIMAFCNQKILVKQKKYQKVSRDAAGEVSDCILSSCKGMASVKAYGAQLFTKKLFQRCKEQYNRSVYRAKAIDAGRLSAYSLANYATLYGTLLYFGYRGIQEPAMIDEALVFIILLRQLLLPAEVIFRWMSNAVVGLASWERIDEVFDIPVKEEERRDLPVPEKEACAKQIFFGYEEDKPLINGMDIHFSKGEFTVLRGRSGCGKTTLCKILCGLYPDASIKWEIDGKEPMHGNAKKWITYSPAQSQIFSMSIYENLVFDNKEITREMCMELADELGIGEWIRSLPQRLDTVLDAGGKMCSGGQRQTLMNMRALLSEKPVLILDEACSALDVEKREKLLHYLERRKEEKAILLIAHQEEVGQRCEKEIVM